MRLLTDELRALIGTRKVYTAPEELGSASGRYFGLAIGDLNPFYSDAEFARAHGLAGVTAPPTLICETNQYANIPMDAEGYAGHTWGLKVPSTRTVRGGNSYEFYRRVRPDDVITATWEIVHMAEKRTGAGTDILIVTSQANYTNQRTELLATNDETMIYVSIEDVS